MKISTFSTFKKEQFPWKLLAEIRQIYFVHHSMTQMIRRYAENSSIVLHRYQLVTLIRGCEQKVSLSDLSRDFQMSEHSTNNVRILTSFLSFFRLLGYLAHWPELQNFGQKLSCFDFIFHLKWRILSQTSTEGSDKN